jgi:hypothetical protein
MVIPRDGGAWRRETVLFLLAGLLAGSSVVIAGVQPRAGMAALALVGGAAAVWLFFQPRIAFLALVLFVPTQFWWTDELGLLPGPMRFFDDVLFGLLAVRVLADRLRTGRSLIATRWDVPILIFLGVGLLSALVNEVPFANAVAGIRAPLLFALLFYIVVNAPELFDTRFLDWIWRVMLGFALVQVLTGIYQYPLRSFGADSLTGTLGPGGANDLGVFLLPFLFYLFSLRLEAVTRPRWVLPAIVVLVVTTVLCGSRAAWFISLGAMLLLWGRRFLRVRTLVIAAVAGVAIYLFVSRIMYLQGSRSMEKSIGLSGIYAALFLVSSGGGNFAYFPVVWRLVTSSAVVPALGLGPGMVSSSAAVHLQAPLYTNLLYDYFGQTMLGLDGEVESQLLATGSEFGLVGLAAGLAVIILWMVEAIRARRDASSAHERALATGVFVAALGALLLTPIRNAWEVPHIALSLWLPGTILYVRRHNRGPSRPEKCAPA